MARVGEGLLKKEGNVQLIEKIYVDTITYGMGQLGLKKNLTRSFKKVHVHVNA